MRGGGDKQAFFHSAFLAICPVVKEIMTDTERPGHALLLTKNHPEEAAIV